MTRNGLRPLRPLVAGLLAFVLSGCGDSLHVKPGQPDGPPPDFPPGEVLSRVFLVGDAGAIRGSSTVMPALVSLLDEKSYTVFLGDNIYDWGNWEEVLGVQLEAVGPDHGALFISGNHDWDNGFGGFRLQAEEVRGHGADFLPEPGCPGPEVVELPGVRIVAVDSQWWLLPDKEKPDDVECPHDGPGAFAALAAELAKDGPEIVVGHHPLQSYGKHGGHFPWYQHLMPPVLGTLYVWSRQSGITSQDLSHGDYQAYVTGVRDALAQDPPLLYAAGHEHDLQVLGGGELGAGVVDAEEQGLFPEVVSGAGSKGGWVGAGERTLFSQDTPGFMVVTVLADGRAALEVYRLDDNDEPERAWAGWLRE
jgi:hypothetical protein